MIYAIELQEMFETALRSKDKVKGKLFQTSDMDEFFNQSQTEWLRKMIIAFDTDERAKRLLSPITKEYSVGGQTPIVSDGLYWNLYAIPDDTYSVVMESIIVTINGSLNTVKVKPITYDEYLQNINNKYRKPDGTVSWRLNNQNGHSIISIYNNITDYKLTYLRKPSLININANSLFDFDEEAKNDIVNAAVELAIKSVEVENTSTKETTA